MSSNVEVKKKNCLDCGKEFDSRTFIVCGCHLNFDRGYCPVCRQEKYEEMMAKEEVARLATVARKRRRWRNSCGIPNMFMDKQFDTFEQEQQLRAYKKCLSYAENFPLSSARGYPSLLLFSPSIWGVGKTHLVCSIAHHILNRWDGEEINCPILFTTESDLFRRIQATYSIPREEKDWREGENDVFNHLIRAPLLVLDDIGKEERADPRFVQRVLFAIIDGRYRAQLPMVLTTNLSPAYLSTHLGGERGNEAAYDRLIEMTNGTFIQLKGESYRRQKGTK